MKNKKTTPFLCRSQLRQKQGLWDFKISYLLCVYLFGIALFEGMDRSNLEVKCGGRGDNITKGEDQCCRIRSIPSGNGFGSGSDLMPYTIWNSSVNFLKHLNCTSQTVRKHNTGTYSSDVLVKSGVFILVRKPEEEKNIFLTPLIPPKMITSP
jgi:hypothetical protein